MKSRLLSTTAALSVALASIQPWPLLAQPADCPDGAADCAPAAASEPEAAPEPEPEPQAAPEPEPEAAPEPEPEPEAAPEPEPEPEAAPEPEPEPQAAPEPEPEPEAAPEPEPEPEAAPEPQVAPEPEPEPQVAPEPEPQPEAAPEPEPEPEAAPEPEARGSAEPEAPEAETAEPAARPSAPEAAADAPTDSDSQAQPGAGAEAPAETRDPAASASDPPDAEALREMLEQDDPATTGPEAEAEAPAADQPAARSDTPAAATDEPDSAEPRAPADAAGAPGSAGTEAPDAAAAPVLLALEAEPQEAPVAAAATSPEEASGGEDEAETAVITEENSRSSAEDFATSATGSAARERNTDDDDDDDGLSNLQKFGLLALGGLAVGALLNNGNQVVSNSGDRVVVQRPDGGYMVLKDDDTLLRRPGSEVRTRTYDDGSTRSVVTRQDGTQIVTIRDAAGRVLRRSAIEPSGRELLLIDDLATYDRVDLSRLPEPAPVLRFTEARDERALREALEQARNRDLGRSYSLRQIRDIREVRALAPAIDVDQITFASGSAAIRPDEAEKLAALGRAISDMIAERPDEVFLIEGHTDAVGSDAANLALSDRRAESVALALTEYFRVPPENMVVQGYGESDLRVRTEGAEQRNRRAVVRLITPLLQTASR